MLVVDDEESVRYSFRSVFSSDQREVVTAATAAEGLALTLRHSPEIVVLDLQLPDRTGLELFAELRQVSPRTPVVFITAHGTTQAAIEAMKQGAFDYLIKPLDLDRLTQVIERAFEAARMMRIPAVVPDLDLGDQIVGRSAVMQEMCKSIGRMAPQDVNVLILGESGTGKELVARALYRHSRRAEANFLAINCAAIPETLLESELFGHEAGAFTGAVRRRIGKFEQCHGGTLFLDEIGEMSHAVQAKLLRVVQEQRFERVGGTETMAVNVRILFATNQDLPRLVGEGHFRKDLFYRLNAVSLQVPPLRQHIEDVPELAHYFLFRFNRDLNLDFRGFAPEVIERLQQHDWPGNVRELQGAVQQAMLNASGHLILLEFLPASLSAVERSASPERPGEVRAELEAFIDKLLAENQDHLHERALAALERVLFTKVLQATHGNQARASELLGLNRATLRHRLRTLKLAVDKVPVDIDTKERDEPA